MLTIPKVFIPQFDEEAHRYTNDQGVILPGVTSVLSMLTAAFYGRIDKEVLRRAADLGSAVHACIEYAIADELDESSMQPEWVPYFDAWKLWCKDFKPEFIHTEMRLGCDLFCGTVDCVANIEGSLFVIDWKTTEQLMKSVALQTAGYELLIRKWMEQERGEHVSLLHRAALQLKDNGKYVFEVYDDIEDYRRFGNCLELYQWTN